VKPGLPKRSCHPEHALEGARSGSSRLWAATAAYAILLLIRRLNE
jgi:hypothetical protein